MVALALGVDTTITAAEAPGSEADEVPSIGVGVLAHKWATRVTLAGVDAFADLTTAHLQRCVDTSTEALRASGVGKMDHVDLLEVASDAAAAEKRTPAGSPAHLTLPVLVGLWNADGDDAVVVDLNTLSEVHDGNVVHERRRTVLSVQDHSAYSHVKCPLLVIVSIMHGNVQDVNIDVARAIETMSSRDGNTIADQ